jgi:hypothetical protein
MQGLHCSNLIFITLVSGNARHINLSDLNIKEKPALILGWFMISLILTREIVSIPAHCEAPGILFEVVH